MSNYIRIYEDIIEHGRNMGFPETKVDFINIQSIPALYQLEGSIYKLVEVTPKEVKEIEKDIKKEEAIKKAKKEKELEEADRKKYEELKKRFG